MTPKPMPNDAMNGTMTLKPRHRQPSKLSFNNFVLFLPSRFIVAAVVLGFCVSFYREDTVYAIPGEYVSIFFYFVVWINTKLQQASYCSSSTGSRVVARTWDLCLGVCLALWFFAPLWFTYNLFVTTILLQSLLLGIETRRRMTKEEELNRKKVDDFDQDQERMKIICTELPTNDVALKGLRDREAHLRSQRRQQKREKEQEAILLAGSDPNGCKLAVV